MGPPTLKPPHTHSNTIPPTYGITYNKLVITVAAQKDICPQGNTYPKKETPINNKKRTTPLSQTSSK